MVSIPTFRHLPSLATVSSVPVRYYFFLCVWALGRLAWFSMLCVYFLGLHSSLFPSVRHFLSFFRRSSDSVESPLHYATGSPLWAESAIGLASWHSSFTGLRTPSVLFSVSILLLLFRSFSSRWSIGVPVPHGSPLLLVALLLLPPRSFAGFLGDCLSCWVPYLSLRLPPIVFSDC